MRTRSLRTQTQPSQGAIRDARRKGRRDARSRQRGVTLIELLIVVAIVGILSLLAVAGYRRITQSSKMAEATHMVAAIKIAQEAYKAETGSYLSASSALAVNGTNVAACYPPGTGRAYAVAADVAKYSWEGWTSTTASNFAALGVHADGPVAYCYSTVAGAPGAAPTASFTIAGTAVAWATGAMLNAAPWYIVGAQADLDFPSNGVYGSVVGTSWQSGLMIDHEGE